MPGSSVVDGSKAADMSAEATPSDVPAAVDTRASDTILCSPGGKDTPCYTSFKFALIACHCGRGVPWQTCLSQNILPVAPYDKALQNLATCVEQACDLCAGKGYDTLSSCAAQKCPAETACCYGSH